MEQVAIKTQPVPCLERQPMWLNLPSPIVEECLAFLRTGDVMSASGTCKHWQNIITSSKHLIQNTVFDQRFSMYARKEIEPDDFVIDEEIKGIIDLPVQNAVAVYSSDNLYTYDKESGQRIDRIDFEGDIECIGLNEDKTKIFTVTYHKNKLFDVTTISLDTNGTFSKSNETIQNIFSSKPMCVTGTNEQVFVANNKGQIIILSLLNKALQEGEIIELLSDQDGDEKKRMLCFCYVVQDLIVWKNRLYYTVMYTMPNFKTGRYLKMYDLNEGLLTNIADSDVDSQFYDMMKIVKPECQNPLLFSLVGEKIKVWSMSDGECLKEICIGKERCYGLAISYANYRFFTLHEEVIQLWTMDGKLLERFPCGKEGNRAYDIVCTESGHVYAVPQKSQRSESGHLYTDSQVDNHFDPLEVDDDGAMGYGARIMLYK